MAWVIWEKRRACAAEGVRWGVGCEWVGVVRGRGLGVVGEAPRGGEGVGGKSESEISSRGGGVVLQVAFVGVCGWGGAGAAGAVAFFDAALGAGLAAADVAGDFLGRPRCLGRGAFSGVMSKGAALMAAGLLFFLEGVGALTDASSASIGPRLGALTFGGRDCKAIRTLPSQHLSSNVIICSLFLIGLNP